MSAAVQSSLQLAFQRWDGIGTADTLPAIMVRPIHVITDAVQTERWPKASFEIDEEVFVRSEPGVYVSGQVVLILPTEHGETVYAIRTNHRLLLRTKSELAE